MQSFQTVPNVFFLDQAPFYESKKIGALLKFFSYLSLHFLFLGLFVKSGNKEVNKKRERESPAVGVKTGGSRVGGPELCV